jgi:hypothetical protein
MNPYSVGEFKFLTDTVANVEIKSSSKVLNCKTLFNYLKEGRIICT